MALDWALWPRLTYAGGLELQERLRARRARGSDDLAAVLEHDPVVTLGPRADGDDLLVPVGELERRGITVARSERGGLATYHGPGQLVVYPIVALKREAIRSYVGLLEDAALAVVTACGVAGTRRNGHPGVWVGESKVASIGIRVRGGIACHGLAINLTVDCTPFSWIRPCGLSAGAVTSIAALGGRPVPSADAARIAVERLAAGLGAAARESSWQDLEGGEAA